MTRKGTALSICSVISDFACNLHSALILLDTTTSLHFPDGGFMGVVSADDQDGSLYCTLSFACIVAHGGRLVTMHLLEDDETTLARRLRFSCSTCLGQVYEMYQNQIMIKHHLNVTFFACSDHFLFNPTRFKSSHHSQQTGSNHPTLTRVPFLLLPHGEANNHIPKAPHL